MMSLLYNLLCMFEIEWIFCNFTKFCKIHEIDVFLDDLMKE